MIRGFLAFQLIVLIASSASAFGQDVTTWHYDNARTGVQPNETILTPSNVASSTFGKVFSLPVIGDVYAQPLYLSQYLMSDGVLHNVLLVATAEDYVYAFDADGKNPTQGYIWCKSMLGSGETWATNEDVNTTDIKPNIGVIGTPVVDRAGGTIYLVAKSKTTSGTVTYYQRLHALNIADGTEKLNGPTIIQATVNGTGDGGTTVSFSPLLNNQRSALLLTPTPSVGSGNSVFIAWASHGDKGAYHGWVIAYDAANISIQNGAWSDTPDGVMGGIWMSGGGLSSDDAGSIYFADGNGTFDANSGGVDYGDTAIRLNLDSTGLTVADYFTPGDQSTLDSGDKDMGTGAVTLLPVQGGSISNLMVTVDKLGTIYLIDSDKMGGYTTPDDSSLQNFGAGYLVHSSFGFFNNMLYAGADRGPLLAFAFDPVKELLSTVPQSSSSFHFGCSTNCIPSGATPSISANGTANGIIWALDNSNYYNDPAILHAFAAGNLATELYNSTQAANSQDAAAIAIKFTTPTIASGRVYVGGRNAVTVYGLLKTVTPPAAATPEFSLAAGTYTGTQTVKITDSTANSSIYYTTNGSSASIGSTLYAGSINVASSETINAIAIASGYSQSAEASAAYTIKAPVTQTEVSLSSVANSIGIYTDGTKFSGGGLNGSGSAYSKKLLGNSISYSGVTYAIGAANKKNVVKGTKAPVIPLTSGKYTMLKFLGAAVVANQRSVTFKVTYTDGSTTKFTQSISDWLTPQHYAGESIALASSYCDTGTGGRTSKTYDLYQYTFALNSSKTVKSLTMPSNSDVAVVAITLLMSN
jgi:hypothetical protein